jgi:hypothetical protein
MRSPGCVHAPSFYKMSSCAGVQLHDPSSSVASSSIAVSVSTSILKHSSQSSPGTTGAPDVGHYAAESGCHPPSLCSGPSTWAPNVVLRSNRTPRYLIDSLGTISSPSRWKVTLPGRLFPVSKTASVFRAARRNPAPRIHSFTRSRAPSTRFCRSSFVAAIAITARSRRSSPLTVNVLSVRYVWTISFTYSLTLFSTSNATNAQYFFRPHEPEFASLATFRTSSIASIVDNPAESRTGCRQPSSFVYFFL